MPGQGQGQGGRVKKSSSRAQRPPGWAALVLTLAVSSLSAASGERIYRVIDLGPITISGGGFVAGFPGDGKKVGTATIFTGVHMA